jgi:serine/threonine protein kinase
VSFASGEVCPPQAPSGVGDSPTDVPGSGPRACVGSGEGDEQVAYVAFTAESGSVSKMAIVRSKLARVLGRYLLGEPIAAGGMATVHLGRLIGPAGFSRTVAVKRMHAHLAASPEFVDRFVDEARIASRVRHGNVVQTLDIVVVDEELLLVLDYVHGESFARLRRLASAAGKAIPPNVAAGIVVGVLRGLHAAHEAKSAKGTPLELVHRDVSPQNILVGADGVARVLDFGIAKAAGRVAETLTRKIRGKLAYMPPEQVVGDALDRRTDLFAAGVVLWEALAGERLFRSEDTVSTIEAIHNREPARLSERDLGVSAAVDDVLARALAKNINDRYDTADAMARALEAALAPASDREIAEWVQEIAGALLVARADRVAAFEGDDTGGSRARLFAARSSQPPSSSRRDALAPPPLSSVTLPHRDRLDSVTSEGSTMPRESHSMPTLAMEAAVALAASQLPVLTNVPGSVALEGVTEPRAQPTPLVMVAPVEGIDSDIPESGQTRIEPVERRSRYRTPIPMPMLLPKRRGPSPFMLAVLVVAPSLLILVALAGGKMASSSRAAAAANAASTSELRAVATATATPVPPVSDTPVSTTPASPTKEEPPAAKAEPMGDAGVSAAAASPATASKAGRKARPVHRAPRVVRPIPVAMHANNR